MRRLISGLLVTLGLIPSLGAAQTPCQPDDFLVDVATPVSSRINWAGDPVQAILVHPLSLYNQTSLPAGTVLKGKVLAVEPSHGKQSGKIRIGFVLGDPKGGLHLFPAKIATPDGWLSLHEQNTDVWRINPNHSTRLLNQKIEQRLGSSRAVWVSVLGINENTIPDPTSDAFMIRYNRNDVMVGAGDSLKLRIDCFATFP